MLWKQQFRAAVSNTHMCEECFPFYNLQVAFQIKLFAHKTKAYQYKSSSICVDAV